MSKAPKNRRPGPLQTDPSQYQQGATLARRDANSQIVMSAEHQGPLPLPSMLREYNEIIPGLGAKIVNDFEAERTHRHTLETGIVEAQKAKWVREGNEHLRGQLFGFVMGLAFLGSSTFVIVRSVDKDSKAGITAGGTLGVAGAGAIVTAFLAGSPGQADERAAVAEEMIASAKTHRR